MFALACQCFSQSCYKGEKNSSPHILHSCQTSNQVTSGASNSEKISSCRAFSRQSAASSDIHQLERHILKECFKAERCKRKVKLLEDYVENNKSFIPVPCVMSIQKSRRPCNVNIPPKYKSHICKCAPSILYTCQI